MSKWIWMGMAVVILAMLLGIRLHGRQDVPTGENASIVSFSYSHTGSSTGEIYSYAVETEEETERMMVHYELNCGYEMYELPADEELLKELSALIDSHNLERWNGFDKSNSLVMDGSGFYLRIDFSDGTRIMARGSNSYPTGYGEAVDAIDVLFLDYLKKAGIDPEEGF